MTSTLYPWLDTGVFFHRLRNGFLGFLEPFFLIRGAGAIKSISSTYRSQILDNLPHSKHTVPPQMPQTLNPFQSTRLTVAPLPFVRLCTSMIPLPSLHNILRPSQLHYSTASVGPLDIKYTGPSNTGYWSSKNLRIHTVSSWRLQQQSILAPKFVRKHLYNRSIPRTSNIWQSDNYFSIIMK